MTLRRVLAVLLGSCAVLPPVLETAARGALDRSLSDCSGRAGACVGIGDVDLDAAGLRLREAWIARAGIEARADAVLVHPGWDGVTVHVAGLSLRRLAGDPARPDRPATAPAPTAATPVRRPSTRIDTRGIPVRIAVRGAVRLPEVGGIRATVHDPVIGIDAAGAVTVELEVEARRGRLWAATRGRMLARPAPDDWRTWSLAGAVAFAGAQPLSIEGTVGPRAATLEILDPDGGRARAVVARPRQRERISIEAERFSLGVLDELVDTLAGRERLDVSSGTLDGAIELERTPDGGAVVHLADATVDGVRIDDPRLSRDPVVLEGLSIDGDVRLGSRTDVGGQLVVSRGPAQVQLWGQRRGDGLEVHAVMPPTPCQDLLDAMPAGMKGVTDGTRLRGDIEARFDLDLDLAALADRRARPEALDESDGEAEEPPPPGGVHLAFPFLERCEVQADAPAVDVPALLGPYRHRFVDERGKLRKRRLAPGGDGYVPLASVPRVAAALVTLEDSRFFEHDGFDREQMENALWQNLVAGGIRRGASTITQQTARNLFLGIDRSLARKLQEALLTRRLEAELPKRRILEVYINIIELGPGIHGVEDAARFHFGKAARDLEVLEAVHLAALAPAPHAYSERFADGEVDAAWLAELRHQVVRMARHGLITRAEMQRALVSPLRLVPRRGAALKPR